MSGTQSDLNFAECLHTWVSSQFSALWTDQENMDCSPLQLEEELAFFLNKYSFSTYLSKISINRQLGTPHLVTDYSYQPWCSSVVFNGIICVFQSTTSSIQAYSQSIKIGGERQTDNTPNLVPMTKAQGRTLWVVCCVWEMVYRSESGKETETAEGDQVAGR